MSEKKNMTVQEKIIAKINEEVQKSLNRAQGCRSEILEIESRYEKHLAEAAGMKAAIDIIKATPARTAPKTEGNES